MPTLLKRVADYKPFTAMVVGDFMLDQSVYGAAERLSPDAPVPVLHESRFEDRAGGAGNVAVPPPITSMTTSHMTTKAASFATTSTAQLKKMSGAATSPAMPCTTTSPISASGTTPTAFAI